jgi:hypothetical protein
MLFDTISAAYRAGLGRWRYESMVGKAVLFLSHLPAPALFTFHRVQACFAPIPTPPLDLHSTTIVTMSSCGPLLMPARSVDATRPSADGSAALEACMSPRFSLSSALGSVKPYSNEGALVQQPSASLDGSEAAAFEHLRGSWQLAAVGRTAAAAVLADLGAAHIPYGGREGIKTVASGLISEHRLDDTFYVMDLANVVRLYKVGGGGRRLVDGG